MKCTLRIYVFLLIDCLVYCSQIFAAKPAVSKMQAYIFINPSDSLEFREFYRSMSNDVQCIFLMDRLLIPRGENLARKLLKEEKESVTGISKLFHTTRVFLFGVYNAEDEIAKIDPEVYDMSSLNTSDLWKIHDDFYKEPYNESSKRPNRIKINNSCYLRGRWTNYVHTKVQYSVLPYNSMRLRLFFDGQCKVFIDLKKEKEQFVGKEIGCIDEYRSRYDVEHFFLPVHDGHICFEDEPIYTINTLSRIFNASILLSLPEFDNVVDKHRNAGLLERGTAKLKIGKRKYAYPLRDKGCHYILRYMPKTLPLSAIVTKQLVYNVCLMHVSLYSRCLTPKKGRYRGKKICSPKQLAKLYNVSLLDE